MLLPCSESLYFQQPGLPKPVKATLRKNRDRAVLTPHKSVNRLNINSLGLIQEGTFRTCLKILRKVNRLERLITKKKKKFNTFSCKKASDSKAKAVYRKLRRLRIIRKQEFKKLREELFSLRGSKKTLARGGFDNKAASRERLNPDITPFMPFSEEQLSAQFSNLERKTERAFKKEQVAYQRNVPSRFRDILSPEHSKIEVTLGDKLYPLHANLLSTDEGSFIAAQIPEDRNYHKVFWKAAFDRSTVIVDLTKPSDIAPYYPLEVGQVIKFDGDITVKLEKHSKMHDNNIHISTYSITVAGETKEITRIHFQGWLDHTGGSTKDIGDIVKIMNKLKGSGIPIVHCRAGVGRTGTIITAARIMELQSKGRIKPNDPKAYELLDEMILEGRLARGRFFVQNQSQYSILLSLINEA